MVSKPRSPTMESSPTPVAAASNQSPLSLHNNMSNLMSTKLDSTNYMIWKLQISAILDAYSVIDHLDGSTPQPRQVLISETRIQQVNPAFLIWQKRDKALLSLLYSTLSSSVLAMVVGLSTSQEVWDKLEERFTCTARANVLNLKLELQSIKKGNESVNSYLQRIKTVRDKLSAVGVHSDHEELLHVILKGLPKEYAPFASAIRTRDGILSLEKLLVLLQTEEQSMQETNDPFSNSALAIGGRSPGFNNQNFNPSLVASQSQQQSQQSQFAPQVKSERPTCQICWKQGHYAIDYYHRMDFAYQGKNAPTKLVAMASASNIQHTQNTETWLTDSSASDHITASSNNLSTQAPYQGQEQVSDLPTGRVLYKGLSKNGVYPIQSSTLFNSVINKTACTAHSCTAVSTASAHKWQLWHSRLGHPSHKVLTTLFPSLQCNSSLSPIHCKHCLASKMHKLPFPVSNKKSTALFALVHADLWGPAPITSFTGFRYYLVLVDDFTKFTWTYLLKHKLDTFSIFTQFQAMVQTQFSLPIQVLRTDCGGEFISNEFNQFCANKGIIHQLSCPHTPQQNGTVERKHKHLIQCALALLSESTLPMSYWFYVVSTATHLINRLPTPNLNHKTPWEMLFHASPDLTHLKSFGCQCFPLITPYTAHKLHPKTIPCVFLGYPSHTKGYLCLDPITQRLYTSRHVLFNECIFPGLTHSSDTVNPPAIQHLSSDAWINSLLSLHTCIHSPTPPLSTESTVVPSTSPHPQTTLPLSTSPLPSSIFSPVENFSAESSSADSSSADSSPANSSQSQKTILPQSQSPLASALPEPILNPTPMSIQPTHPMQTRSKSGIVKPKLGYAVQVDYSTTEPTTYSVASKHPQWCNAMNEEFQALQKQGTWILVPAPSSKNIVGCKWVYKLKYNSNGSISRYKARLVAKGFHQQYGVDFDETFSLVIKPPTVRLILSLATSLNWPLRQLDVKNAFLHGTLKEEVYMAQPPGYIDPTHPSHVCRLQKSIYGLKQAPRAWFESFTSQLLHLGFIASTADSSLFIYTNNTVIAYLLLYVDDIVLTSNTPAYLDHLITQLSTVFDLKDLGSLHYFLGLQVTRDSSGLYLNQAKYANDLLKKHNMLDSKPAKSPSCPNTRLSLHEGDPLSDPHGYRSLVGALHYLTFTRLDISFSVHQVCQYMSAPTTIHLAAAKRILRYLRGTLHHGIAFTPGPLQLSAYTDADWAGDPDDRRSTFGYLVYLGSNPITWSAKKQPTVSRSSTESEYRALAIASAELYWIRTLLKDLGIYLSQTPILWCDNIFALAIASNLVFHARTKHIEVDFHFVREQVLRKDLEVKFVSTIDQLADIFTKSLPTQRFIDLRRNLMVSIPVIEGGC
uniref:Integrase catalytic domain-containing protein n=1 Tax=Fagus sylvatica TaxID=28930 RepID=A0A2N9HE34_FAGSY